MPISAETFTEVISKMSSDSKPPSVNERRRWPRVGVRTKMEIEHVLTNNETHTHEVQLKDLSHAGISFLQKIPIARGQSVRASFNRQDSGITIAEYEVCYCHAISPTLFLVGGELKKVNEYSPHSPEAIVRMRGAAA